jgi:hypothetical protein
MRATLVIADDVWLAAKDVAKRDHKTVGQVISQWARQGLQTPEAANADSEAFLGFRPLPARNAIISSELLDRLLDEG